MKKSHIFLLALGVIIIALIIMYFFLTNEKIKNVLLSVETGLLSSGVVSIFIEWYNNSSRKENTKNNCKLIAEDMWIEIENDYSRIFEYINYSLFKENRINELIKIDKIHGIQKELKRIVSDDDKYLKFKESLLEIFSKFYKYQGSWDRIIKNCEVYNPKVEYKLDKDFNYFYEYSKKHSEEDRGEFIMIVKQVFTLFKEFSVIVQKNIPSLSINFEKIEESIKRKYRG